MPCDLNSEHIGPCGPDCRLPRPDRPLRSPLDCKHNRMHLIQESRSGPPPLRESVWICRDCGQFSVSGWKDGVTYRVEFTLSTRASVEAAGRYLRYLESED